MMGQRLLLGRALSQPAWSWQGGRTLVAGIAVALGVALGAAVHLVNHSAAISFERAARALAGSADLTVRGPRGGFAESVYPVIAATPGVMAVSPAVELEATGAGGNGVLRIVGIDAFRTAVVQPQLLGPASDRIGELLGGDTLVLSGPAAERFGVREGESVSLATTAGPVPFRIIAVLPAESNRQEVGFADIATAQWRFGLLGRLNRLDVRIEPAADPADVVAALTNRISPGITVRAPAADVAEATQLSRAYRVNLDMLALVALFTGGFLVFSTQVLAVLRRRPQIALLRALGVTRARIAGQLLLESTLLGGVSASAGILLALAGATVVLAYAGGNLGAGYFDNVLPTLYVPPRALAAYFILGVAASVAGTIVPALEAVRADPARALHAGDEQRALERTQRPGPGLALAASAAGLAQLPAVWALPVFGYAAIACMLAAAILLMPICTRHVLLHLPVPRWLPARLAIRQIGGSPGYTSLSLAAILVSFSLLVSMLVMVHSFRASLDEWLERLLPADLYLRSSAATGAGFDEATLSRIASTEGVARITRVRHIDARITAGRPPVTLIARDIGPAGADPLPLVGPTHAVQPGEPPPAWITEVVRDTHGLRIGQRVDVPIAGALQRFTVAGVWRDYGRQNGAVLIDYRIWAQASGDLGANDVWIWLASGASAAVVLDRLRSLAPPPPAFEARPPGDIRAMSLALFDRTFAITYALEIAAIVIGLIGISTGFGAHVASRSATYGMLRHVGLSQRAIGHMLAVEGGLVGAMGALLGLATGWLIGVVLVHVVNRQSFHWSMDLHPPWLSLLGVGALLVFTAAATAAFAGRAAVSVTAVRAVREDW
jgi:putative ABC transport system permease protein